MTRRGVESLILWICCILLMHMSLADDPITPLFVFGDSHFDPGNNNYINTQLKANYKPYGMSFIGAKPTGRFSDGRTMADFIGEFANLSLLPPHLKHGKHKVVEGANFASAGAGAQDIIFQGSVIPLSQQVQSFHKVTVELTKEFGSKTAISKAVHLISIGGNDILAPFLIPSQNYLIQNYTYHQYAAFIIGNITTHVKALYSDGGRKFAFLGVDSLGCAPAMRYENLMQKLGGDCHKSSNKLAKLFNTMLIQQLEKLAKEEQGFKYAYLDSYTLMKSIVAKPSKYGLKEAITACCGSREYRGNQSCGGKRKMFGKYFEVCENPHEYVFFDGGHFSEETHKIHAKAFWSANPTIPGSYTVEQLFKSS